MSNSSEVLALRSLVRKLAGQIADQDRRLAAVERPSAARYRSIEGGTQTVYDDAGQPRIEVGVQPDGSYTKVERNAPAPVQPSQPLVEERAGMLVVTWDGLTEDGSAWRADFARVEVHLSTLSGFDPTDATQVTEFTTTKGGTVSLALDTVEYFIVLVAANHSNVESAASLEASGTPLPVQTGAGGIKTYVAATEPLGLTASDDGALWYDSVNGNRVSRWDGDLLDWILILIGQGSFQNDAVTQEVIASGAVTSEQIADAAVLAGKLADGAVSEAKIAVDAITETKIADDAITTPKIVAGAVKAGQIDAGAVTTEALAANAIAAGHIQADAIVADKIATDAVTSDAIEADAITANEIAAGAVEADHIHADAVTADKIHADAINGKTITGGTFITDDPATEGVQIIIKESTSLEEANKAGAVLFDPGTPGVAPGKLYAIQDPSGASTVRTAFLRPPNLGGSLPVLSLESSENNTTHAETSRAYLMAHEATLTGGAFTSAGSQVRLAEGEVTHSIGGVQRMRVDSDGVTLTGTVRMPDRPYGYRYKNANQTISTLATWTDVPFQVTSSLKGGMAFSGGDTFTVPDAGVYQFTAVLLWQGGGNGTRAMRLLHVASGAEVGYAAMSTQPNTFTTLLVTTFDCSAGWQFKVQAYVGGPAAATIEGVGQRPFFSVAKL